MEDITSESSMEWETLPPGCFIDLRREIFWDLEIEKKTKHGTSKEMNATCHFRVIKSRTCKCNEFSAGSTVVIQIFLDPGNMGFKCLVVQSCWTNFPFGKPMKEYIGQGLNCLWFMVSIKSLSELSGGAHQRYSNLSTSCLIPAQELVVIRASSLATASSIMDLCQRPGHYSLYI